jgi:hypothetical protein
LVSPLATIKKKKKTNFGRYIIVSHSRHYFCFTRKARKIKREQGKQEKKEKGCCSAMSSLTTLSCNGGIDETIPTILEGRSQVKKTYTSSK